MIQVVSRPNRRVRRALELQQRRLERRALRDLSLGGFSTSSSSGATLSVNALLKQPVTISRDLTNVILQRGGFLADQLLVRGSAESVAGGAMVYHRSGSAYLDRDVEEIAEDGDWPRTGWSEDRRIEAVKQYGLEVPITNLAIRRNQVDQVTRAERRLANQIVKFVDTKAITMLRTDPDILTINASNWTSAAADIISDLANGQEAMDVLNEGIWPDTLVLPKTMRVNFLANSALRSALQTTSGAETIRSGDLPTILGIPKILYSTQIPDDEALLVDSTIAGTIADEPPDPQEGWQAYNPGPGFAPIYVQVYPEKRPKRTIVAGGRWPAMVLIEPRAVLRFTSTTS